jgi:hypothetical protein
MKTAVEWLEEMFSNSEIPNSSMLFKQAKKMEKKQIMEAWLITKPVTFNNWKNEFEQYYNETFKSE